MTVRQLVLVLGSYNESDGSLSTMAIERLKTAITFTSSCDPETKPIVICSGGFGAHFNRSSVAHWELSKNWLIRSRRLPSSSISSEGLPATHTIEEAVMFGNWLQRNSTVSRPSRMGEHSRNTKNSASIEERIVIISSDFHMPRVELIFSRYFPERSLTFVAAPFLPLIPLEEQLAWCSSEGDKMHRILYSDIGTRIPAPPISALHADFQNIDLVKPGVEPPPVRLLGRSLSR